jgi:hypothetical protein
LFESGSQLCEIESYALASCESLTSICIPCTVEVLGEGSFKNCRSLSTLSFESVSRLRRIESQAFSGCSSLKSIVIPQSIESLSLNWSQNSSLSQVTFESSASLQMMIDRRSVDLSGDFKIEIISFD